MKEEIIDMANTWLGEEVISEMNPADATVKEKNLSVLSKKPLNAVVKAITDVDNDFQDPKKNQFQKKLDAATSDSQRSKIYADIAKEKNKRVKAKLGVSTSTLVPEEDGAGVPAPSSPTMTTTSIGSKTAVDGSPVKGDNSSLFYSKGIVSKRKIPECETYVENRMEKLF